MATISEIASRLNLNKSTVSRALNNRPASMSDETRAMILRVAHEMGYVPNPAARALAAGGRSGNIGLVGRKFNNALYTSLLLELAIAVDERGGNLVTCVTGRDATHHGQDHLLHSGVIDGMLAFPYALPGLERTDSPWMRLPIVFLLSAWDEDKAASVRFDDEDGAHQVARHLWEQGHRRLLLLQGLGPTGEHSAFGVERHAFLRAAWKSAGGSYDALRERAAQATAEGGYEAMNAALDAGEASSDGGSAATAIVAYSDQMALGALRAIRERGLRVPTDLSLVGWNDIDDAGRFLTPGLTSVRTSTRALAEAAVELLYQRIDASPAQGQNGSGNGTSSGVIKNLPERVRVPVELIVRESTRGI